MERAWTKVAVLVALVTVVLSCGGKKNAANQSLTKVVPGTWQGTISCADCPGIAYELELNADKTFREKSVYLEEDVQPFIDTGRWNIGKDSIITLDREGEGVRYFKFTGETLKMLDTQKQPITSSLAEFYILKRTQQPETQNP